MDTATVAVAAIFFIYFFWFPCSRGGWVDNIISHEIKRACSGGLSD